MDALAMHHIQTYGWLCEDSLHLAAVADDAGMHEDAEAYRECARLWSERAFQAAQS